MAELDYDARRKAELIAELDAARRDISRLKAGVRRNADVTAHIKKSFFGNKVAWIGGAVAAGLVLALLFRPRRKTRVRSHVHTEQMDVPGKVVRTGILLTVAKFAFSVLEPVLKNALRKYVTSRFVERRERDDLFGF